MISIRSFSLSPVYSNFLSVKLQDAKEIIPKKNRIKIFFFMDLFNNRQRYYFIMRIECIFIVLFFFNTLSPNTDHCSHQHRAICKSPLPQNTTTLIPISAISPHSSLFSLHSSLFTLHHIPKLIRLATLFTLHSSLFTLQTGIGIILCWFALFSRLKIANTWLCRGVR